MSFTVLVPARLQSTRLPRKPLADINGLPMIVRVAQRAALSGATIQRSKRRLAIRSCCRPPSIRSATKRTNAKGLETA